MRTASIIVAALAVAATPAVADPWTTSQSLNRHLSEIGRYPPFSAMWIDAIPRLAELCDMKVSKVQLFNVSNMFRGGAEIGNDLRMLQAKPDTNMIYNEISDLDQNGKANESCDAARRLWGEDGDMFPGVLTSK